jgi:hypothetical protein
VPSRLLGKISSHGVSTFDEAARWTTASMPANAGRIASRSTMSATWLGKGAGRRVRARNS